MNRSRIAAALASIAVIAVATTAYAAGIWPNLPQVGGAAYCAGSQGATPTVGGTTGQGPGSTTCAVNVPAGPSIVTGLETIPADTNASGGAPPQTVKLGLASLNALPYRYSQIGTGAVTYALTENIGVQVFNSTGAVTSLAFTLPPSPIDGQRFKLSSTQTISSLTVSGAGGSSVSNAPTVLTVSTTGAYGYEFLYAAAQNTWYRVQ